MVHSPKLNQGFTLIELMISLVLGLLITAAATQIYLINVRTAATQKSGSEIQDASVFGLQQLEARLRIANLGNSVTTIDNTTAGGGIVLSPVNINLPSDNTDYISFFTKSADDPTDTNPSNMNAANSDQLTIQFKNTTGNPISDCESADVAAGETAIERYFLRASSNANQGLVLACDAGRVNGAGIITTYVNNDTKTFGINGQEFITGVDQFKILLGTQTNNPGNAGKMQYFTPKQYQDLTTKPPIVAVKVGIIARGSAVIVGSPTKSSFDLFGTTYTLKSTLSNAQKNLVRNTYESTTLLRNARVVNVNVSADLAGS